jgi:hypothetical protein
MFLSFVAESNKKHLVMGIGIGEIPLQSNFLFDISIQMFANWSADTTQMIASRVIYCIFYT